MFFVGNGKGIVKADGALTSSRTVDATSIGTKPVESVFALMGGQLEIQTSGRLALHAVFDPTLLVGTATGNNNPMYSYDTDSSVTLRSLNGDIEFSELKWQQVQAMSTITDSVTANKIVGIQRYFPGTLNAEALLGSISSSINPLELLPSASGNLRLLADQNINFQDKRISMSEADASFITRLDYTAPQTVIIGGNKGRSTTNILHKNDPNSAYIVARKGDIRAQDIYLPKQARIVAGNDYVVEKTNLENMSQDNVSVVKAGRDIKLTGEDNVIRLGGPGQLVVQAGRDIDLGKSYGIETTGNLNYVALPQQGADITVMAGVKGSPRYSDFIQRYFVESDTYANLITQYMMLKGYDDTSLAAFLELDPVYQQQMVLYAYFNELRENGRTVATNGGSDYSRGFAAINTLFPHSDAGNIENYYNGNLSMYFSKVYSLQGGDINILTPGGLINAGLATRPANAPDKLPSQLGIVARGVGNMNIFAYKDVQVNQSRVFTLNGGDIFAWSSKGNIDAGRGAKSSISAPPTTVTCDFNGNCTVDASAAISGSGIRSIQTDPEVQQLNAFRKKGGYGNVDLVAVQGTVDAGDAQVIGAENIDIAGISVGVPVADTGITGFSGVTDVAGGAIKDTEASLKSNIAEANTSQTPLADEALSYLEVVVLGLGEDDSENSKEKDEDKDKNKKKNKVHKL
jgi:filamentous hemagglutinin